MKPTISLLLIFIGMSVAGQSGHQAVSSGAATEQNGTWTSALVPALPSLVSVSISPSDPTQAIGFSVLLTATGTYTDGSTSNITQSAAWSTGNPEVAIFGSVGTQQTVTCLSAGTSVITATSGSFTGSTTVTCLALTSIAITPATPTQSAGSSVALSANGTYSDGSVQSITVLASWTSSNTAVAAVGAAGDPQTVSCLTAGTSTVTAKVGTVSGSTVLTCSAAVGTTAGCGAGPNGTNIYDQSTCGNYAGAPYEDLATTSATTAPTPFGSGSVHNITACTAIPAPTQGDVWRFANDINDGVGGTNQNCIQLPPGAQNYVVDLAGHTLTGGISFPSGGITGVTIVNGTINCNIANGGIAACIMVNAGGNPSKSFMLSHLTVNNANSPTSPDGTYSGFEYVIFIEADGTTIPSACPPGADQKTFNGSCIEVAHVSTTPAAGYTGAGYSSQWCGRCTNIWMSAGGGNSFEVWNTVTTCGGYVDACQGIVTFNAGAATIHNNGTAWTPYLGAGDNGRVILFDSAGKPFNSKCKEAFNNLIAPFNSRSLRTREEGCVAFHDNLMIHVQGGSNIQEGANDDYAENLKNNTIAHNTFMFEGGHGFVVEGAYGVTVDSNNFVCVSNCSTVQIGSTQVDNYTFGIASMSRTAACVVTLTLTRTPSTTSNQSNITVVNVQGTGTDFDVSGTAGNVLTSHSGTSYSYTQAGCTGAAGPISPPSGAIFWMAANATDNFAANGAQVYVKNSTIDPALTFAPLFVACGQQGHSNACTSGYSAQSDQNGGQTQMQYCNNVQNGNLIVPVAGSGALVTHFAPDSACP